MRAAHKRVAVIVFLAATSASACASDVPGMQGQNADAGIGGNASRGGVGGVTVSGTGGAVSASGGAAPTGTGGSSGGSGGGASGGAGGGTTTGGVSGGGKGGAAVSTGGSGSATGGALGQAGGSGGNVAGSGGKTSTGGAGGAVAGTGGAAGQSAGGTGMGGASVVPNLRDIVARLSGETPIDGVNVLRHRATEAEREAVRVYLIQVLNAAGLTGQRQAYATGTNVFADLPATTGADQPYVIFGAHYDSVSAGPGANDNATGVAAVLGVAEHVARLTQRSKNFTFVLFDEEEVGLRGSASFASRLVSQGRNVHSAHTIDQMGWDMDGDRAIELEMPAPALQTYYQQIVKAGAFKIPLEITDTTATDHDSFRARGFPTIGITEEYRNNDTTPYYHKAGDTYATVNFDYLDSTVAFMKYLMADLAK